jgi:hypothetical protein
VQRLQGKEIQFLLGIFLTEGRSEKNVMFLEAHMKGARKQKAPLLK